MGLGWEIKDSVVIGTTPALKSTKAIAQFDSTERGVLIPRMTTAQMNAIAPALSDDGLQIYNTDTKSFWHWNGTIWVDDASGAGSLIDSKYEVLTIASDGQTSFTLAAAITIAANKTKAFVNGAKLQYGIEYTIVGTAFTFLNADYSLETIDLLEVYYG